MRRKEIRIMLAASFLVMIVLAGCYCYEVYLDYRVPVPYNGRVMAVPIVEDLDFLEGKERRFAEVNPGICFGGGITSLYEGRNGVPFAEFRGGGMGR